MEKDKEQKEVLELARRLNNIIQAEIRDLNRDLWKENWKYLKEKLERDIKDQKQFLQEYKQDGFKINQAVTEGYIISLEEILNHMNQYGE